MATMTASTPKQLFERICRSVSLKGTNKSIEDFLACIIPHPEKEGMVFLLAFINDERENARRIEEASTDGFQGDSDAIHASIVEKYEPGDIYLWCVRPEEIPRSDVGFVRLMGRKRPLVTITLPARTTGAKDQVFRSYLDDTHAERLIGEILAIREETRHHPAVVEVL
jgi:hypothetical protein